MSSARDFEDMAALVTGGASGIGAAVAELLMERGARVAVLDRDVKGAPPGTLALEADVTDDAGVRDAVERAVGELGALHTVVSNAGIGAVGTVEDNDDAEWHRVLDVNVLGMVRVARHVLPHLRRAAGERPGRASLTQTCSIAATAGLPQRALYSAAKGAVLSLTLAMAADHVREGCGSTASTPARRTPPGSPGCSTGRTTRRPSGPPSGPASRWDASLRRPRSPPPSPTSQARRRPPSPARPSRSTAACRACACDRAARATSRRTGS